MTKKSALIVTISTTSTADTHIRLRREGGSDSSVIMIPPLSQLYPSSLSSPFYEIFDDPLLTTTTIIGGDLPVFNVDYRQFLIILAVVFVTGLSSDNGKCPSNKLTAHDFSCRAIRHLADVTKPTQTLLA